MNSVNRDATPSIRVGDDGEIVCTPPGSVPSDTMLEKIIERCRGTLPNGNLFLNIRPEERHEFESKGWQVAGIVSNFFDVGNHALRMKLLVSTVHQGRQREPLKSFLNWFTITSV